jgi:galactonate dehydratase
MMTHAKLISDVTLWRANVSAKTTWLFLRLRDNEGYEGWGEATSFGNEVEISSLVSHLSDIVRQSPARTVQPLIAALHQVEIAPGRRALLSAIEQAGLDLAARRADVPLADMLGGARQPLVPFYANINRGISDRSPEGFAQRAREIVGSTGACAVKIAPFDGYRWDRLDWLDRSAVMEAGLARVAAVSSELKGDADVFVDCHERFDLQGARVVVSELCRLGVAWVEDPTAMALVAPEDQRRLRAACHAGGARLAGGESIINSAQMAAFLAQGGHDVVLPDLRVTGLQEGMAMLRLAASSGVATSLHNPVGPILDAISVEVAASLPAFLVLERQIGESEMTNHIRSTSAPVKQGRVRVSEVAGFGFTPDIGSLTQEGTTFDRQIFSFTGTAGAGPDA